MISLSSAAGRSRKVSPENWRVGLATWRQAIRDLPKGCFSRVVGTKDWISREQQEKKWTQQYKQSSLKNFVFNGRRPMGE